VARRNGIDVRIEGVEAMRDTLRALGPKLERNYYRKALRQAGKVLIEEAKARVAVRGEPYGGTLKRSLSVAVERNRRTKELEAVLQPSRINKVVKTERGEVNIVPRNYAHLVEYGAGPHRLGKGYSSRASKAGRALQILTGGGGAMHPGAKAQPFLRPALDAKGNDAAERVAKVLADALKKEGLL
jgi:HK97 gp10 family phage protein